MISVRILGYNGLYETKNQPSSGYLVEYGDKKVLIDCGFGIFSSLCEYAQPEKLDLIILSHTHFDHMGDIGAFNYYLQQKRVKLPLRMPLERDIDFAYSNALDYFNVIKVDSEQSFELGGAKFILYKMAHTVLTFGVRIEYEGAVLAYSADTNLCDNILKLFSCADLAICDAAFTSADWSERKPHLSASKAAEYARKSNAKRLVLSHLSPNCEKKLLLKEAKAVFDCSEIAQLRQYVCLGKQ